MDLASQIIQENKRTQFPFLDLGNCNLENTWPKEILDCFWLEGINFSNRYYSEYDGIFDDSANEGQGNIFSGNEGFEKLQQLPALRSLHFSGTKLSNINFLSSLSRLKILSIGINSLTDLTPLASLKHLAYLDLIICKIKDVSPLRHLTELRCLLLSSNPISDISSLGTLTKLRRLDVSMAQLTDISVLRSLTQLEEIDFHDNKICSINGIQGLQNLKKVCLVRNKIRDLNPLIFPSICDLDRLGHLNLFSNEIEHLDARIFYGMPDLKELLLNGNPIKNVPYDIYKHGDVSEIKKYLGS